jgi:hypothetical protein
MPYPLRTVWAVLLTTSVTVLLFLAAGCVPDTKTSAADESGSASADAMYVGNAPCADCHEAQFRSHQGSYHAKTLTRMKAGEIGKLAPKPGLAGKSGLSLTRVGEAYHWSTTGKPEKSLHLDLAFGSGKTGVTYVSLRDGNTLEESRYTYFPRDGSWEVTPGQESEPPESLSKSRTHQLARQCVGCHAITLEPDTLMPRKEFFGVGCESCHGPGGAHVGAMRAGDFTRVGMENLSAWKATRINEMCGKCHVSFDQVDMGTEEEFETHRFTAYGLMKSDCYLRSNDTLSCVTCHEPHTNASRDEKTYIKACLNCHGPTAAPGPTHEGRATKNCPVNPRDGCLTCHMPRRKAFKNTKVGTRLTDHFIRVWMKDELR